MKVDEPWVSAPETRQVMDAISSTAKPAYFVGGCVRNALLGVPASDIDIATPLHPGNVVSVASRAGLRSVPTGIDHGTVTVIVGETSFEITTFRRDVATDGRRATVAFADRIEDDAARRDFTMNALYATKDGDVIDPLGGLDDLEARRIRFIGDPSRRIAEDGLRIVRFFRFYALYGDPLQGVDPDGLGAIAGNLERLEPISKERIGAEMRKLLAAPDPTPAVSAMAQAGVLNILLPGADPRALGPLVHLEQLEGISPDPLRRLVAIGGEDADARLRLSRHDARQRRLLISLVEDGPAPEVAAVEHGAVRATDAILLRAALLEQPLPDGWQNDISTGAEARFPLGAADLLVDYGEGPALGAALARLKQSWIDSRFKLTREDLLRIDKSGDGA